MPIQEKVEQLGGECYRFRTMPAFEALEVQLKLTKYIGPAASELFASGATKIDEVAPRDGANALKVLVEGLQVSEVVELARQFSEHCEVQVKGTKDDWLQLEAVFDEHFSGRTAHLWEWFWRCLLINFKDWLGKGPLAGLNLDGSPRAPRA